LAKWRVGCIIPHSSHIFVQRGGKVADNIAYVLYAVSALPLLGGCILILGNSTRSRKWLITGFSIFGLGALLVLAGSIILLGIGLIPVIALFVLTVLLMYRHELLPKIK